MVVGKFAGHLLERGAVVVGGVQHLNGEAEGALGSDIGDNDVEICRGRSSVSCQNSLDETGCRWQDGQAVGRAVAGASEAACIAAAASSTAGS